jgi:hypothetical protein
MLVAAACYNLKKLLNFSAPKAGAQVMKMFKTAENRLETALLLLFVAVTIPDGWYNRKPLLLLNLKNDCCSKDTKTYYN